MKNFLQLRFLPQFKKKQQKKYEQLENQNNFYGNREIKTQK